MKRIVILTVVLLLWPFTYYLQAQMMPRDELVFLTSEWKAILPLKMRGPS
jgi:hypothetical protein